MRALRKPSPFTNRERPEDFLSFYQAHKEPLYRYALSLVKNPALAEEAVQEAWSRCIQYSQRFLAVPPEKRPAWMAVVVRNAAFTLLAKEQRYLPLEAEETLPAPEHGDVSGIVTLIRTLPPLYRQVLELKLLLEWTDREMARYLGLSEGQVRTRIWRGRKLLQAALRKKGYEYDQG